jgi:hypothetical protein
MHFAEIILTFIQKYVIINPAGIILVGFIFLKKNWALQGLVGRNGHERRNKGLQPLVTPQTHEELKNWGQLK